MYYAPTPVNFGDYRFLILSQPDQRYFRRYISDMKEANVKMIVRTCVKTYDDT